MANKRDFEKAMGKRDIPFADFFTAG